MSLGQLLVFNAAVIVLTLAAAFGGAVAGVRYALRRAQPVPPAEREQPLAALLQPPRRG